jgi:hypothetical protein
MLGAWDTCGGRLQAMHSVCSGIRKIIQVWEQQQRLVVQRQPVEGEPAAESSAADGSSRVARAKDAGGLSLTADGTSAGAQLGVGGASTRPVVRCVAPAFQLCLPKPPASCLARTSLTCMCVGVCALI